MSQFLVFVVAVVFVMLPALASAQGRTTQIRAGRQTAHHASEASHTHRGRREGLNLPAIGSIRNAWQRALAHRDRDAEHEADLRLRDWLARELQESQWDAAESHGEVSRSREAHHHPREREVTGRNVAKIHKLAEELRSIQPAFLNSLAAEQHYQRKEELLDQLVRSCEREVDAGRESYHHNRL